MLSITRMCEYGFKLGQYLSVKMRHCVAFLRGATFGVVFNFVQYNAIAKYTLMPLIRFV